ncbi:hypothetical protein DVH24_036006 [Malus domestica]|uniref:Translation elongation factor EFG/EF2 domain-containing protein n=1 Tax=Malus domestica TaxID=3750 RepID=A0A498JNL3_MALDO|nr:hypothetical protein DVH24_036006 [Malus domestica]
MLGTCLGTGSSSVLDGGDGVMMVVATVVMGGDDVGRDSRHRCESGEVAIEPKTKADVDKMGAGLVKLAQEDPSFHFSREEEINQTVIEGMGELHLEIIVDRLKRDLRLKRMLEHPRLTTRKAFPGPQKVKSKGGAVPREYIPGVMKGLEECMSNGVLAGFPVIDVRAVLVDGSYQDVDSSVLAFQLAARGAFRDGMKKAALKNILETLLVVDALVPLAEMFQYVSTLRGMTKGRASYTMQLAKFDVVPQHIQN